MLNTMCDLDADWFIEQGLLVVPLPEAKIDREDLEASRPLLTALRKHGNRSCLLGCTASLTHLLEPESFEGRIFDGESAPKPTSIIAELNLIEDDLRDYVWDTPFVGDVLITNRTHDAVVFDSFDYDCYLLAGTRAFIEDATQTSLEQLWQNWDRHMEEWKSEFSESDPERRESQERDFKAHAEMANRHRRTLSRD
ncbi:MAG: hypothetical protein RIG82_10865 [Phycisphaeraceae bacterium]